VPGAAAGQDGHLRLDGPVPPHRAARDLADPPGVEVTEAGERFLGEFGGVLKILVMVGPLGWAGKRSRTGLPAWARLKSATRPWWIPCCPSPKPSAGLVARGAHPGPAWTEAARAAASAAQATASLRPLKGRARPLAEKSLGTADPGATSLAMIFTVMGPHFTAVRQPVAAVS
jgi:hypothetical protein